MTQTQRFKHIFALLSHINISLKALHIECVEGSLATDVKFHLAVVTPSLGPDDIVTWPK